MDKERLTTIFTQSLQTARNADFSSYDVSDLMKTRYNLLGSTIKNLYAKKVFMKPYSYLVKYKPEWLRQTVKDKYYKYPQGVAMTIRGLCGMAKKNINVTENLALAIDLANWLVLNKSEKSNYMAWGQPYIWYSRKEFPANIPRATVSSQVGWAFLDLYDCTKQELYLDYCLQICESFKKEFHYKEIDDALCISYTTVDDYNIHNANVLASSMIARTAILTNNQEYKDFATKATRFTLNHQNKDGSFYYWAPPNKLSYKIDNIHTGFVVESLSTLKYDLQDSSIDKAYADGIQYYAKNLFEHEIPKLDIHKTYPVDIQSCAQAIITFADSKDVKYSLLANTIMDYTIDNFFLDDKNYFAYRIHNKSGLRDTSYYFRWGDAWMLKAIPYLL